MTAAAAQGSRRVLRRMPAATSIAKNGSTKIRWRDSGEVEPPRRAARKAATGTPTTQRASTRVSRSHAAQPDQREREDDEEHRPARRC